MTKIIFSVLFFYSSLTYADNPEIILEESKAEKLYAALNVEEVRIGDHDWEIRVKEVGKLFCYTASQTIHRACVISENLSSEEIKEIFERVEVPKVFSGIGGMEVKHVSGLIFRRSIEDTYSLLTNDACGAVENFKATAACILFWGQKVYSSFIEDRMNAVIVSHDQNSFEALREIFETTYLKYRDYFQGKEREDYDESYAQQLDQLERAQAVGVIWQDLDREDLGGYLNYVTIENGSDVAPQVIYVVNLDDTEKTSDPIQQADLLSLRVNDFPSWNYEKLRNLLRQ